MEQLIQEFLLNLSTEVVANIPTYDASLWEKIVGAWEYQGLIGYAKLVAYEAYRFTFWF